MQPAIYKCIDISIIMCELFDAYESCDLVAGLTLLNGREVGRVGSEEFDTQAGICNNIMMFVLHSRACVTDVCARVM